MAADAAEPPRAGFLPFSPPPLSPAGGRGAQFWCAALLWGFVPAKEKRLSPKEKAFPKSSRPKAAQDSPICYQGLAW